ncbi:MAG: tRNA (adenosine(37)-N6)-threonylcarbamoyltransferase complex ATPase subunit type 1 TsaE [Candidatus Latescibacteria bacterium]|nr:tRNA (adenosine(37)-N6)-threonylcarbamoyltransferase complex ATPase subunit type 1 TsaE [Candidatus Latescibacterota bacterium]
MDRVESTLLSRSPEETQAFGRSLAGQLKPGDLVAFEGDLGAGKTCLIQGICQGLEVRDYVNSPTFILINEYLGRLAGAEIPVYHFDCYRLTTPLELEDIGAEEYFYGRGICLVEWAGRAGDLLPPTRRLIQLDYLGPDERRLTLRQLAP